MNCLHVFPNCKIFTNKHDLYIATFFISVICDIPYIIPCVSVLLILTRRNVYLQVKAKIIL